MTKRKLGLLLKDKKIVIGVIVIGVIAIAIEVFVIWPKVWSIVSAWF